MGHIAAAFIRRQEARKDIGARRVGRKAFHIIGVVCVGVLWVQPNEAVSRLNGRLVLEGAVVSVNQFELRLFCVFTKRIP